MRTMTTAEVAALLNVSTETVRRWARTGYLPSHRLGPKTIRYDRVEIERWWQDRQTKLDRLNEIVAHILRD